MLKSFDKSLVSHTTRELVENSFFYKLGYVLLLITVFVNVAFPKAGIKLGGIPLTVGNVFLILTILVWITYVLYRKGFRFSKAEVLVVVSCMYWASRLLIAVCGGRIAFGEWAGYFVPTVVYPFTFLVFNYFIIDKKQLDLICKMLFWASIIVYVFGFLQAIFGIDRFSIPGLTVNLTDYLSSDNWYAEKYNGVQEGVDYAKTVSTYQNGNLLGVNIMLFGPLVYENIQDSRKRHFYLLIFAMFCLLTGSKTCWVGLFIYLCFKGAPILNKKVTKRKTIMLIGLVMLLLPVAAVIFFSMFPQVIQRFQDSFTLKNIDDLSGRSDSMNALIDFFVHKTEWLLVGPYGLTKYWGSSYEMTYFCMLMIGGLFGVFAFVVPIFYVLFKYIFRYRKENKVLVGIFDGVLVYMIMAYVEGAFWLPPTAINIWMVLALGYNYVRFIKQKEA